jgi:WD40 repeat protein
VAYSSDGKTIASTGIDAKGGSSLRVFDKEDFKDSRIFKRDGGAVDSQAVAISPDGKSIAAAHYGVFIWNQRGVVTHHIPGHRSVAAIAFSPDGKRLAFASETGSVQIWDVEKRKAIHPTAEDHSKPINGVAVSRDGKHVATACQDGIARLWELSSGKFVRELRLEWGAPYLWDVAFSPDGKTLAVAHQREGISLWDYTDGKLIRQLAVDKDGRADEGHFSIAFSPDGKTLAANSVDGGARLFDAKTGDKLKELGGGRGTSVAYSSGDGALLAAASDNQVTIWHADTGKVHLQLNNHASSVAVSKDGRFIAGASNWDLRIWDAKGKEIGHIKERRYGIHSYFRVLEFSPNGKYLAVADSDKVMIWDTGARKQVHSFAGHRGIVTTLSFTPDGSRLISGGEDCTLLVWDFAKFAEKK